VWKLLFNIYNIWIEWMTKVTIKKVYTKRIFSLYIGIDWIKWRTKTTIRKIYTKKNILFIYWYKYKYLVFHVTNKYIKSSCKKLGQKLWPEYPDTYQYVKSSVGTNRLLGVQFPTLVNVQSSVGTKSLYPKMKWYDRYQNSKKLLIN
jgi:hypothetical protein